MPIHSLRSSQLITTFGTGALVDLPDTSVIIGGPDHWDFKADERAEHIIHEPRLNKRITEYLNKLFEYNLGSVELMRPPIMRSNFNTTGQVPAVKGFEFPEWFVVQNIEDKDSKKRRRLVNRNHLDRGKYRDPETNRAHKVVPVRFVRACESGHVDDIDWLSFVHGYQDRNCPRALGGLYMVETGSSGALSDIQISCDCGKSQRLVRARQDPTTLGFCSRKRPWLGSYSREEKKEKGGCKGNRLLVRNASNAYFAQLYSIISIPETSTELGAVIKRFTADLQDVKTVEDLQMLRKFNKALAGTFDSLKSITDADIIAELERLRGGGENEPGTKLQEFRALSGPETKSSNVDQLSDFSIRYLDDQFWKDDPLLQKAFSKVVLVHRLREVVAQVGFTRFESPGKRMDGELDLDLEIQIAPLAKDKTNVVPSFENRGEGIFLHFSPEAIHSWETSTPVQDRAESLRGGADLWASERGLDSSRFSGMAYYMLHTFAHMLIQEISLECGYPTSSLKERIYCEPIEESYGILIYTGSPDAEGTLGGLVHASRRIKSIVQGVLINGSICSSDPVCSHTKPNAEDPSRLLLGSACHSCTHLPETCCEQMNQMLDRSLVVPTMEGLGCEFFKA